MKNSVYIYQWPFTSTTLCHLKIDEHFAFVDSNARRLNAFATHNFSARRCHAHTARVMLMGSIVCEFVLQRGECNQIAGDCHTTIGQIELLSEYDAQQYNSWCEHSELFTVTLCTNDWNCACERANAYALVRPKFSLFSARFIVFVYDIFQVLNKRRNNKHHHECRGVCVEEFFRNAFGGTKRRWFCVISLSIRLRTAIVLANGTHQVCDKHRAQSDLYNDGKNGHDGKWFLNAPIRYRSQWMAHDLVNGYNSPCICFVSLLRKSFVLDYTERPPHHAVQYHRFG